MIGMFAISKAGHDKGKMYLVVGEDETTVDLSDGRIRTLDNPKKKKKKHVQIVKKDLDPILMHKLLKEETIYNEEIKHAIRIRTNKEVTHVEG
ncbi:MAG: hypothetical protein K2N82_06200 [Lachnospiraceae bacterium]|nr:hypothetical protein [Lachnospiraceae bacterium]